MGQGGDDSASVVRGYSISEEQPDAVIRRALADMKNTTPESLEVSLEDYVDVEALGDFLSGADAQTDPTVKLGVDGYLVTVTRNQVVVSVN